MFLNDKQQWFANTITKRFREPGEIHVCNGQRLVGCQWSLDPQATQHHSLTCHSLNIFQKPLDGKHNP